MATTLRTRSTRASLRRAIASIPQELTEGGGSKVVEVLNRCGSVLLDRIKTAYMVRSAGGTDESGLRWAPLKPATVAYSRSGRSKRERSRSSRPSQALTRKQQQQWWSLYRQGLAIYRGDKASAAKRAWGILKRQGVTTLISKYGGRKVPILYDTGGLYDSISSRVSGAGEVTISSSHPVAAVHHNGSRSRGIPQRRLWPGPADFPPSWWNDMIREVRNGVAEMVAQIAR